MTQAFFAAPAGQPAPQPVQNIAYTTQQAYQQQNPPAFQAKFALFPATRPGTRYQYSGNVSVPHDQVPALIQYLQSTAPDQRGNVTLFMLGFDNQSRQGTRYIGGFAQPDNPPVPQPQPMQPQGVQPAPVQPAPTTQTPPVFNPHVQQPPF